MSDELVHRFTPPHPVNASRRQDLPILGPRRDLVARHGLGAKTVRSIKHPDLLFFPPAVNEIHPTLV